MPIPQKTFSLWNGPESPFQNLIKRTFARGLIFSSSIQGASIVTHLNHRAGPVGCVRSEHLRLQGKRERSRGTLQYYFKCVTA
ncbi:hypothetical protein QUB70_12115 [Microcoleus sp. A003_D6]